MAKIAEFKDLSVDDLRTREKELDDQLFVGDSAEHEGVVDFGFAVAGELGQGIARDGEAAAGAGFGVEAEDHEGVGADADVDGGNPGGEFERPAGGGTHD